MVVFNVTLIKVDILNVINIQSFKISTLGLSYNYVCKCVCLYACLLQVFLLDAEWSEKTIIII